MGKGSRAHTGWPWPYWRSRLWILLYGPWWKRLWLKINLALGLTR